MKITPLRVLAFLVLVAAFFGYFGIEVPDQNANLTRIDRAWSYCAFLFLTGAGCASFGDQEVGMFPPTSLRWLCVLVGTIIMLVSAAWMTSIDNVAHPRKTAANAQVWTPARW